MSEQSGDVPQPVRFVTVDRVVVRPKGSFETIEPNTVQSAKALPNQTIEGGVRTFLGTTFNHHLHEFNLKK